MIIETITVILSILAAIGAWSLVGAAINYFTKKPQVGDIKWFDEGSSLRRFDGAIWQKPVSTVCTGDFVEPSKETK